MLSKKSKTLSAILIIASLFLLNKFGRAPIKNAFYTISAPIEKVFWWAGKGVSETLGAFFEIKNLKRENQEFSKQNLILLQELTTLKNLRQENEALREILNLELHKKFELSSAEIIEKELDNDFILISKGKEDGVLENMPLITKEGVLVGKVKESFANFSKVMLITAKKSVFDVEIGSERNIFGVAQGKGNLRIEFDLVLKENQIKKGDIIQTISLGGNFPKGLLVGEIEEVQKGVPEPYQKGTIKPYFLESRLNILFIIKGFVREDEPSAKSER